jgi:membrane protease YdiL (CAAX protease family)
VNNDWISELKWTAVGYGLIAAVVVPALLAFAGYLFLTHKRFLPLPRLRPGAWGGHEVFVAFCIVLGVPTLVVSALLTIEFYTPLLGVAPEEGKHLHTYVSRSTSIASPLTLATVLGLLFLSLYLRSQTRPRDFGLSWARWPANLALGGIAFLVLTPLVLGLHALVTIFHVEVHPFVEMVQHMEGWEWIFLGFQTIIQAPIMEEILFRGVLLGWLRRASLSGHLAIASMTVFVTLVFVRVPAEGPSALSYIGPGLFALVCAGGYCYAMYRMARNFHLNESEIQQWDLQPIERVQEGDKNFEDAEQQMRRHLQREADERRRQDWQRQNARLAIFGSAMLFAVFHTHDWPAPIALIVLALALGWLATRTQSLLAPIALHALFNLASFIALYGVTFG